MYSDIHNINLEQQILASVFDTGELHDLEKNDFYAERHQHIFSQLQQQLAKADKPDLMALHIDEDYLRALLTVFPMQDVRILIAHLKKLRQCRHVEQAGEQLKQLAKTNPDDLMSQAFNVLDDFGVRDEHFTTSIAEASANALKVLAEREQRKGHQAYGVSTMLTSLDQLMGDIEPSHLCIIAASPGNGKSTLAQQIALNACLINKRPTLFFSLEMKHQDVAFRLVSSVGKISFDRIKNGKMTDDDYQRWIQTTTEIFAHLPLEICDKAALSIAQVKAECRQMQRKHGSVGCIVIDYLQLMTSPNAKNRFDEVSEVSRALKQLAKDFNCPVIALSQMNRAGQKGKPTMGSLRESGQIEQDADQILFIYRACTADPDVPDDGTAELILAKNRHGKTGTVRVVADFEYCRFCDEKV